jgi:tellurite resistance protein TerC
MKWVIFNVALLAMVILDLKIFHRKPHEITVKESLIWSAIWIGVALLYNAGVLYFMGHVKAAEFFTGYLIERSLSIDNVFVFIIIFSYFKVPVVHQHKMLMWGIIGALVLRLALILIGAWLIAKFAWVMYVFGAFLVFTGIRIATQDEHGSDPEKNPAVKLVRKLYPVTNVYHGAKMFIIENGKRIATPMLVVLVAIAFSDLIFALDSIPAIFAITNDPFIVYTSNAFAILGLQAMYFALAAIVDRFHFLKYGLAVVLIFIGAKMLIHHFLIIPIGISLGVVAGVLAVSIFVSMLRPRPVGVPQEEIINPEEKNPNIP